MNNYKFSFFAFITFATLFTACSSEEPEVIEEVFPPIVIEGNYIGQWSSNAASGSVYNGIPISARIKATGEENKYTGDFFFTGNYTTCCASGKSDGPITMEIIDAEITAFEYMDVLPNCNGNFKGSGTVSKKGRLTIKFSGGDCEGEHTNASLFFNKQ